MSMSPKEEAQQLFDWWKKDALRHDSNDDRLLRLAFLLGFPAAVRDGFIVQTTQERATAVFEIAFILNRLPDHDRLNILASVSSIVDAEMKCRGVLQSYLDGVRIPKADK